MQKQCTQINSWERTLSTVTGLREKEDGLFEGKVCRNSAQIDRNALCLLTQCTVLTVMQLTLQYTD